mgnify:CR=1 FL=1
MEKKGAGEKEKEDGTLGLPDQQLREHPFQYVKEDVIDQWLMCNVCLSPMVKPVELQPCRHACREECVPKLGRCGECSTKIESTNEVTFLLHRMLNSLEVYCTHNKREKGCQWEGRRDNLDDHLKTCAHYPCVNCKKGCVWEGRKGDLASHLATDCLHVVDSCPFQSKGCQWSGVREVLDEHLATCPEHARQLRKSFRAQVEEEERKRSDEEERRRRELMMKDIEVCRLLNPRHDGIVTLNIGGRVYKASQRTLCRYPESRLGLMFGNCGYEVERDDEGAVFLDLDGKAFRHILMYLRHGVVPKLTGHERTAVSLTANALGLDELSSRTSCAEIAGEGEVGEGEPPCGEYLRGDRRFDQFVSPGRGMQGSDSQSDIEKITCDGELQDIVTGESEERMRDGGERVGQHIVDSYKKDADSSEVKQNDNNVAEMEGEDLLLVPTCSLLADEEDEDAEEEEEEGEGGEEEEEEEEEEDESPERNSITRYPLNSEDLLEVRLVFEEDMEKHNQIQGGLVDMAMIPCVTFHKRDTFRTIKRYIAMTRGLPEHQIYLWNWSILPNGSSRPASWITNSEESATLGEWQQITEYAHFHDTFSIYSPYIPHIFSIYSPYIPHIFSIYSPYILHIFSIYSPYILHIFPIYSPYILHIFSIYSHIFSIYSPYILHIFSIYSRFMRCDLAYIFLLGLSGTRYKFFPCPLLFYTLSNFVYSDLVRDTTLHSLWKCPRSLRASN